jgi:hypothetical protein
LGVLPQYYILQGVRRSVAARDAGLSDIPAFIVEEGKADVLTRIPLYQLHSPKHEILRDYRYIRDTEYPTRVLKTEPPPIIVEPLGAPGQGQSIPISQVVLK